MKKFLFFLIFLTVHNSYCMVKQEKKAPAAQAPKKVSQDPLKQAPKKDKNSPEKPDDAHDFEALCKQRRSARAQSLADNTAKDDKIDSSSLVKNKMLECIKLCNQALDLKDEKDAQDVEDVKILEKEKEKEKEEEDIKNIKVSDELAFFIDPKACGDNLLIKEISVEKILVGNAKYSVCEFLHFSKRVNILVEAQLEDEYDRAEPGADPKASEKWRAAYPKNKLLVKRILEAKAFAQEVLEKLK